jgi:hypothetical protein
VNICRVVVFSMCLFALEGYSKGLDDLSPADRKAPPESGPVNESSISKPGDAPKAATPPVAAPVPVDDEEDADDLKETQKVKPGQAAKEPQPPSRQSKFIAGRLALGTSLGLRQVKPAEGTWTGVGAVSVHSDWRLSEKPEGKFFARLRYSPYAGIWKVDDRFYDTTFHGFFAGVGYFGPITPGGGRINPSLEVGYLMVYARPQDGEIADTKVKKGKISANATVEALWVFKEKIEFGPFLGGEFGGIQAVHGGIRSRFVF